MGSEISSQDEEEPHRITRFDNVGFISYHGNYVIWQITQFFSFSQSPDTLISSTSFFLCNRWYELRLSPSGREHLDTNGWLGLYLVDVTDQRTVSDGKAFKVTLGILGVNGDELRSYVAAKNRKWYRVDKLMHRGEFKKITHQILVNGTLRLFCNIDEKRNSGQRMRSTDRGISTVEHRSNDIPHDYSNNTWTRSPPLAKYWSSDMPHDYSNTLNYPRGEPQPTYSNSDLLRSPEKATNTGMKYTVTEKNAKFPDETQKKGGNHSGKRWSSTNSLLLPKDEKEKKGPGEDRRSGKQVPSTSLPKGAKEFKKGKSVEVECEDDKFCELQFLSTSKGIEKLLQDFKKLLLDGTDSDITIKVEEKEFKAHRGILGARSPVFAAMMEHNMKEKSTGTVTVKDMDPAIFQDFLGYLYTGRIVSMSSDKALLLFTVADRYQVRELRDECVEYMKRNMLVDNFTDIYLLSLQHQEKKLSDAAIRFFKKNITKILPSNNWQMFLSENSEVANDLIMRKMNNTS